MQQTINFATFVTVLVFCLQMLLGSGFFDNDNDGGMMPLDSDTMNKLSGEVRWPLNSHVSNLINNEIGHN